ncbi:MAG: site-specific tyrosine recombinase XerC [Thermoanaerobaculia bacterium]
MREDRRRSRRKMIESAVTVQPGTLGYYARQHLRSLEVRNYSRSTIKTREKDLRYFLEWADARAITLPSEVSVPVLERYQRFMYYLENKPGQRLTFCTQNLRLQAVRVFFRWLVRQSVIEMSPAELLELPRREYRLPKDILTEAQVESMMSTCDVKTAVGLRDRAVMELLYSSGPRRFEIAGLKVWDVDVEQYTLRIVLGKGNKDRYIPLTERAAFWIRKYRDEVRPQLAIEPDSGHLFLTLLRKPLVPERVSDITRNASKAAGMRRQVSAHVFRHTMATMMLEGGADIRFVQVMLGHATLTTTEIYTRVALRKLKEVHAMAHPASRLERLDTKQIDVWTEEQILKEALFDSLAQEAAEERD